ncbi:SDR family NAD(P)-dependent oxidoreductase [Streptomyces alboniger]|uniref:SDR family NAD(P)-dependent oxidoreductase n=1 Tax=Streptomyces alboniger TaxID=132473 RepID=UPI00142F1FB0
MAACVASKAGAVAFTLGLGLETAAQRIRCNEVCPGTTHTPMLPQPYAAYPGRRHRN